MEDGSTRNRGRVLTIGFAHLVHDTPGAFLAPVLPLLIEKFGLTVFLAGLLEQFRRLPSLANPFLGLMADRICIRWFIIVMPGVTAVSMSLLGIAPGYAFLSVLLLISGVSSAIFHVTCPVMMKHASSKRIGRGMSLYMFGGELARTLGPLVILGAVSLWGLEGTWRLVPFGVAASVFLYIRLRDVRIEREPIETRDDRAGRVFASLLPFFAAITGMLACQGAMKAALTIYLPTYLTSKGTSLWLAGISLSVLQFSGAAGTFLAGTVSDRIGRKKAMLMIMSLNPLLMLLFIAAEGTRLVLPVLVLTGFFLFASGPVILALVHDIESRRMSFINGIYMTINFTVNSLLVLAVGFAADRVGLDLTYRISAFIAFGSVLFVLMLRSVTPSAGRSPD